MSQNGIKEGIFDPLLLLVGLFAGLAIGMITNRMLMSLFLGLSMGIVSMFISREIA